MPANTRVASCTRGKMPIGRRSSITDSTDARTPSGPSKIAAVLKARSTLKKLGETMSRSALNTRSPKLKVPKIGWSMSRPPPSRTTTRRTPGTSDAATRIASTDQVERGARSSSVRYRVSGQRSSPPVERAGVRDPDDAFQRPGAGGLLQRAELEIITVPEGNLLRIAAGLASRWDRGCARARDRTPPPRRPLARRRGSGSRSRSWRRGGCPP